MIKWGLASPYYVLNPCCGPLFQISEVVRVEVRSRSGVHRRSEDIVVIVNIAAKKYIQVYSIYEEAEWRLVNYIIISETGSDIQ